MGEVDRGHIKLFPELWNLRAYDKTNDERTRIPRIIASYQKSEKRIEDWGDYQKLPEEIPDFPLIRKMLLRAVKGRNAAVLQHTQFVYVDESTRRRMSNAATPKPEKIEDGANCHERQG